MNLRKLLRLACVFGVAGASNPSLSEAREDASKPEAERMANPELAQVPFWQVRDLEFFLHGSMSTEVVPEAVLRAFIRIYPDLFPEQDLSNLGLISDPAFGWPVGFSRRPVARLGDFRP